MHSYRAMFVDIHDEGVIELLVDLGFHTTTRLRFRLHGVKMPSRTTANVGERERVTKAIAFIDNVLTNVPLTLHSMKNPKDPLGLFAADILFPGESGYDQSLTELLLREKLCVNE